MNGADAAPWPLGTDAAGGAARSAPARVAVVVMGMHRAGTSLVAQVLAHLGCDAPRTLIGPSESNPGGGWESRLVREFNDRLLASAGTAWDDWRAVAPGWFASPEATAFHEEALALLGAEFGASHLFVLKDPRACSLAPFWLGVLEAAGIEPRVVLALRNPLEVAASLGACNGLLPGMVHLIWLRHMLDAEAGTRGRPRVVSDHDRMLHGRAREALRMGEALGLSWPRGPALAIEDGEAPVRDDLQHHGRDAAEVEPDALVPDWVRSTFGILRQWAVAGEDAADHARLDAIRAQLDVAGPVFGAVVAEGRRAAVALRQAERRVEELEAWKADAEARQAEAEAALRAADERAAALGRDLHDRDREVRARLEEIARLSRLLHDHESGMRILAALHAARASGSRISPLALRRDVATVRATGLFDAEWYLRSNPDVAVSRLDPLRHYVRHGIHEGRRPNAGLTPDVAPDPAPASASVAAGSVGDAGR